MLTWLRPVYLQTAGQIPYRRSKEDSRDGFPPEPIAKKEGTVSRVVHSLSKVVSTPVAPHYAKAFESVKRHKSNFPSTFVSVVYARALSQLAASAVDGSEVVACFRDILAVPAKFSQGLRPHTTLDEHFVAHLTTIAEIEAQLDPNFRAVLKHAAQLFVETHRPGRESENPLGDPGSGLELLGRQSSIPPGGGSPNWRGVRTDRLEPGRCLGIRLT